MMLVEQLSFTPALMNCHLQPPEICKYKEVNDRWEPSQIHPK